MSYFCRGPNSRQVTFNSFVRVASHGKSLRGSGLTRVFSGSEALSWNSHRAIGSASTWRSFLEGVHEWNLGGRKGQPNPNGFEADAKFLWKNGLFGRLLYLSFIFVLRSRRLNPCLPSFVCLDDTFVNGPCIGSAVGIQFELNDDDQRGMHGIIHFMVC